MKDKIKLLSVKKLKSGNKKYEAKFEIKKSNGKTRNKTIKFGAKGMSDFTIHKDTERRDRYISRHKKDLRTNDPTRAGYLSMYILWNKKTFKASLADYKRRLNTYNRTGKFPIAISGSALKSKFGIISRLDLLPRDIQIKIRSEKEYLEYLDKIKKDINELFKQVSRNFDPYSDNFLNLLKLINELPVKDINEHNIKIVILKELWEEGYLDTDFYTPTSVYSGDKYRKLLKNYDESKKLFINIIKKISYNEININYENFDSFLINDIKNLNNFFNPIKRQKSKFGNKSEFGKISRLDLYDNFESDINNLNKIQYFNETNFGVKNVKFKDNPMIKYYEVEKLKRRPYPNDKIRKDSIKNKRIYIKEFNELSLEFAKFIGENQIKSLFINSNLDCLLYIFKTFFKKYKKIIDKNEFIKYYNTYFYADERLKDESCINDKGRLIITLFNTEAGKNMIEKFNNFIDRKIELRNEMYKMYEIKFGRPIPWENTTFDELPPNFLNDDINNFGKYKVPDNVKNKSLYLRIKNKIGKEVKKKGRRWGAYDSGRLVREYKEKGGKYSGKKSTKTKSKKSSNLDRWYREKWIDACAWPKRKSCGRTKASIKSKVTYCRPSKVIDRNTPKTIQELTKAEIKRKCSRKSKNPKKIIR